LWALSDQIAKPLETPCCYSDYEAALVNASDTQFALAMAILEQAEQHLPRPCTFRDLVEYVQLVQQACDRRQAQE